MRVLYSENPSEVHSRLQVSAMIFPLLLGENGTHNHGRNFFHFLITSYLFIIFLGPYSLLGNHIEIVFLLLSSSWSVSMNKKYFFGKSNILPHNFKSYFTDTLPEVLVALQWAMTPNDLVWLFSTLSS